MKRELFDSLVKKGRFTEISVPKINHVYRDTDTNEMFVMVETHDRECYLLIMVE